MNYSPIDRIRRTLRNERGSIVTSVAFVVAAAVLAAALLALTLSMTLTAASTTAHREVVNSVAQTAGVYRGDAATPSTPAAACTGAPCSTVTDVKDAADIHQVTVTGTGANSSITLEQSLRPVEGTHIAGFDAAGNPVWTNATSPASKFSGYVNGGKK
jgi:hypothetical protein